MPLVLLGTIRIITNRELEYQEYVSRNMKSTTPTVLVTTAASWLLMLGGSASAFSVNLSRRKAIQAAIAGVAAAPSLFSVLPANDLPSEETPGVVTRMGGVLVGNFLVKMMTPTYCFWTISLG
jgi:hypothetical protein